MEKWLDRLWEGLTSNPLSTVAALIIFLLALPLIRAGIGKPAAPPAPPAQPPQAPVPIQIESPWLTQHLVEMHFEIEQIKGTLNTLSDQIDAIEKLIRKRPPSRPK